MRVGSKVCSRLLMFFWFHLDSSLHFFGHWLLHFLLFFLRCLSCWLLHSHLFWLFNWFAICLLRLILFAVHVFHRGLWSSLLIHLLNFRLFCSLHLGKHCPRFLYLLKCCSFSYSAMVVEFTRCFCFVVCCSIHLSTFPFIYLSGSFLPFQLLLPCCCCFDFPFFFFCLSASSILLSFVTIYCFGCALSNKKLRCGRVVMFLAF